MSGAIPPLPQYAFMAWCSVKAQQQLYLYPSPLRNSVAPFIPENSGRSASNQTDSSAELHLTHKRQQFTPKHSNNTQHIQF